MLPTMDKISREATIEELVCLIAAAIKKNVPSLVIYSKIIDKSTAEFTGKDLKEYNIWLDEVFLIIKEKMKDKK